MSSSIGLQHGQISCRTLHQGAMNLLALIESEMQVHAAAAAKETGVLRQELAALKTALAHEREAARSAISNHLRDAAAESARHQSTLTQLHAANDRLVYNLAQLGVVCRADGEVLGYDPMWERLVHALETSDDECPDPWGPPEDGRHSEPAPTSMERDTEPEPTPADPLRDLARAEDLLRKREAKCHGWRQKCTDLEREREQHWKQRKAMKDEISLLRYQLKVAGIAPPLSSPSYT